MDIKSLAKSILPFDSTAKVEKKKETKLQSSSEREGNGQMPQEGNGEGAKRNLTPEEIQEAVEYLKDLPGVKDHNLTVRVDRANGVPVVFVEEPNGKIVRRIPEIELSALMSNRQKKNGHLLDKAM